MRNRITMAAASLVLGSALAAGAAMAQGGGGPIEANKPGVAEYNRQGQVIAKPGYSGRKSAHLKHHHLRQTPQ